MPEEFGRYQLLELIGRGGMGEVYRALDTVRERTVALKLLPDYLAADESFKARFRRESRMAAKLNEPHIIPIHDFGEIDGRLYIDMRLVEGRDLGSLLESRGALQPAVAVDIVAQTAAALDAAHESGLVHRDVKPSNVLLTGLRDDPAVVPFAYLVDFGIARSATQEGTALTATTATVGTVAYMSPERINGKPGDRRTDIYALTCVLFESITGHKPYEGEIFAQMYAHVNTPPPVVSTWVPAATPLDAVIARGMAKDPEDRYGTAGDLATAARNALLAGGVGWSGSAAAETRRMPSPPPSTPLPSPPPPGPLPTFTPPPYNQPYGSANPPTPPPPSLPAEPAARPPNYPTGMWPPTGTVPQVPRRGGPATRRNTVIAVAVAVVVAIVITIVLVNSGNNSGTGAAPTPGVPPSGSKSGSPTSSTSGQPSLNTGSAATPAVSWAHFASFSKLAGTKDDSPSSAWNSGDCTLGAPTSADASAGVADEVNCHYPGSTNVVTVARFDTAAHEQAYLEQLLDQEGFRVLIWTSGGASRGLTYISPSAGTGLANISTTICGLPNYLVQIADPDRTKTTALQLHDQIWDKVQFPDVMPPACDSTYLAAQAGATVSAQSDVSKGVAIMTSTDVTTLLQRGSSALTVVDVAVKTGIEAMVIGQAGTVTFWSEPDSTIEKVGTSTYPYAPSSLGPPGADGQGALLTNMTDATFIVTGTFSGDGSGNAVAYTNGSKGWGAIKAEANGNLAPSGQGVAESGIGLSDGLGFINGQLETIDCSSTLPISSCGGNQRVVKTWEWQSGQFVETGHSGLTK